MKPFKRTSPSGWLLQDFIFALYKACLRAGFLVFKFRRTYDHLQSLQKFKSPVLPHALSATEQIRTDNRPHPPKIQVILTTNIKTHIHHIQTYICFSIPPHATRLHEPMQYKVYCFLASFTSTPLNWLDYIIIMDFGWMIKAVPLQAWTGPEVSRKLRFPDFVTTAQDNGKVVSLTHRPPFPHEILLVLISVGGWVDPRATVRSEGFYVNEKIPLTPAGIEPATFRFVAQHLNLLAPELFLFNFSTPCI